MRRFRFLLYAAAALFLTAPGQAKGEAVVAKLIACTTPDAIEAFTRHVYIGNDDTPKVIDEMGGMCNKQLLMFELGPSVKTFTDVMRGENGLMDYTILPIAVQAEGIYLGHGLILWQKKIETLYVMTYRTMKYQASGAEL